MVEAQSFEQPQSPEQHGGAAISPRLTRFNNIAMPHLDAAYNYARWLTLSERGAEDAVREAYIHAFRSFEHPGGGDTRAWILTIVRDACLAWLAGKRPLGNPPGDEDADADDGAQN
jgi:RNA polymerase sigma-70 factor (ECF subfamily)